MTLTGSDTDKCYAEYLETLKTKIAKYQAKRSLERSINFKGEGLDVKGLIHHLLRQKGHHLFIKKEKGKEVYFIGTARVSLLDLNKTTYEFARFLINKGYANKTSELLNFNKFRSGSKIKAEVNCMTHIQDINLTDVLLSPSNFGNYSSLMKYINGIKENGKEYVSIHSAYDKKSKTLDIYDEEDFNNFSDEDYVKLINVTEMLEVLFRKWTVTMVNREDVLEAIDAEFMYRVNKLTGEI